MLELHDVYVSHAHRLVLSGLSLQIMAGEVYGLLGPNGAGKTTAMRVITSQLTPLSGSCTLLGAPLCESTKQMIGVVPQEICLYDRLTCAENLRFVASLYGIHGRERERRIDQCLALFELSDRRHSLVRTLSGGMQRRLHVAVGMVHGPKLLILDEPTVGMDLESRRLLWQLVRQLRTQDLAILLTTHLVDEAETICDRIGILRGGRLVAEGTLAELRQQIPAVQVVTVRTPQEAPLLERIGTLGIPHRVSPAGVDLWFAESRDLKQVVLLLDGLRIDGLSQRPVSVEDVYFEVLQSDSSLHPHRAVVT